ncbi:hypothetical protein J2S42_000274 [Catenuloplanes indicus]|uniref:Uncharacterized protein n=1 Tax=Catenuloplanes indicus TaxID=137267 RepID=A0AAE3VTY1_9ACTN|nr:hypothetical protein [Catenuloplanes indicus]
MPGVTPSGSSSGGVRAGPAVLDLGRHRLTLVGTDDA